MSKQELLTPTNEPDNHAIRMKIPVDKPDYQGEESGESRESSSEPHFLFCIGGKASNSCICGLCSLGTGVRSIVIIDWVCAVCELWDLIFSISPTITSAKENINTFIEFIHYGIVIFVTFMPIIWIIITAIPAYFGWRSVALKHWKLGYRYYMWHAITLLIFWPIYFILLSIIGYESVVELYIQIGMAAGDISSSQIESMSPGQIWGGSIIGAVIIYILHLYFTFQIYSYAIWLRREAPFIATAHFDSDSASDSPGIIPMFGQNIEREAQKNGLKETDIYEMGDLGKTAGSKNVDYYYK